MEEPATFSATSPARVAGLPSPLRVAAAIDEREERWFLPESAVPAVGGRLQRLGGVNEIRAFNPDVLLTCWSTPRLPENWLQSSDCRLRYVCHLTGSVRHFLPRCFLERGGLVTNWGDIPSGAVAEHALLLALAALRNLPAWLQGFSHPAAAGDRMHWLGVRTLHGRRVGIHGLGRVARALIRMLSGFDSRVLVCSDGVPEEEFADCGVRRTTNLCDLFAQSDVLFECEALTAASVRAVGAAELAALPDGAVFVNVARGGLVDDGALLHEARSGRIRVALDVFSEEPLPADSLWLKVPGAVLSPHIAGPTIDQYPRCTELALANLARYTRGEPLQFPVTTEIYDRAT